MNEPGQPKSVEVVHSPTATLIRVRGVIDEHFERREFVGGLTGARGPVVVDVDEVPRLTSFGVREFMMALREAPRKACFFIRCRPSMVAQFNSIPQLGRTSQLVTLYCPYVCPDCDEDFEVLVDVRDGAPRTAPEARCPTCNTVAELDDIEELYFAYVASKPPIPLPRAVEALIAGDPTLDRSFRVEKEVEGELTALWLHGELNRKARLRRHAEGLEGTIVVVFSGVTSIDDAGVANMAPLLDAPDCELYLVRLPLSVARPLVASPMGMGRARVASIVLRTECGQCSTQLELEVTSVGEGSIAGRCTHCEATVSSEPSAEDRELLAALPLGEPPRQVAAYLRAHFDLRADLDRSVSVSNWSASRLWREPVGRIGDYELLRHMGVIGATEVFLARRVSMEGFEKKLIVRRVLPQLAAEPRFVESFLEQVRIAAKLNHSNIVQIHDLGKDGADYFVAMENVRGLDLDSAIGAAKRALIELPIELCCRIVADVARALEAAHSFTAGDGAPQPVLHRDVSPPNVLISVDGMVKLAGFGTTKATEELSSPELSASFRNPSNDRAIARAPESLAGGPVDHRIDVFAAGLMLYQCLASSDRGQSLPPIRELCPELPEELAGIVSRAIAPDPEARTPTALALQQELEAFLVAYGKPSDRPTLASWLDGIIAANREVGGVTLERGSARLDVTRGGGAVDDDATQELALDAELVAGLFGRSDP